MKTIFSALCLIFLSTTATSQDAVSILRRELERTARERDAAQREYLEAQSEARRQIESLSGSQAELNRKLEEADSSLLELEAEANRSAAAARRAEREINQQDRTLQTLQEKMSRSRRELETLEALPEEQQAPQAVSELRESIRIQARELEAARSARTQALADRNTLQALNTELRQSLQETKRSESLANAKLAALESRLVNLNQELARLYRERSDLEQEQERLKGIITDLEGRLAQAEENSVPRSEMDALQSTLDAAEEENRKLRKQLEERQSFPDLRAAFAESQREKNLLRAKQKTLASKVSDLEATLSEERDATRNERELRRGAEVQLSREKRRSTELEKEIRKLQKGLEAATSAGVEQEELAEVTMLVEELQEENQVLKKQSTVSRQEAEQLMEELTNSDSGKTFQIRELQTMLGEQMLKLTDAQEQITRLEAKTSTFNSIRKQRDDLIRVREKSRGDMRILANHIYNLREQIAEKEDIESQLDLSASEQQKLKDEVNRQKRLTEALRAEQDRKDQEIRELRKRLGQEPSENL